MHQLPHPPQGFASVADGVLLIRRELGCCFAKIWDEKQWVVAEAVGAAGGGEDAAFEGILGGEDDAGFWIGEGQAADEARGALIIGHELKLAQEGFVVGAIALAGVVYLRPARA